MIFYDELFHYGTPRHSGRYPWGSGENPYQHGVHPFRAQVKSLKDQGLSEKEIAESLGMNTAQLRAKLSIAKAEQIENNRRTVIKLSDKGYSNPEISRMTGIPESTIRTLKKPIDEERANKNQNVANTLKAQVEEKRYLDIGSGVESQLGISSTRLKNAVSILEEQGYKKQYVKIEQATNPGKYTTVKVLTKDDVEWKEVWANRDKIMAPDGVYFEDNGKTARGIKDPVSINSDRVQIRYSEDGGTAKDGVIEIRPGVEDISLGQNSYAQVRIAVDGTHYLKGMAMYSDNLPDGCDILFNTNKHKGTPKCGPKDNTVLKKMSSDPDNPFGATIRQYDYTDKNGEKHQSAINIVNDDSDWGHWSKNLSSQFLSKQYPTLAKRQLDLTYKEKRQEYEDICRLENPAVKKCLLESFASDCDASSVDLKAAALPRQQTHVILPLTDIKDNEIYAPNYKTGEEVILVRYPHGGVFEIPRLTVNNNNKQGKNLLGQAQNAVGINSTVAEQLSGADFDGDTVIVIPTKNQNLKTSKPLPALQNFDPKEQYRAYEGMPEVGPKTGFYKQRQMGSVSNLITDMTIKGATPDEISRAVKHSMVIIDAEKHNLNYRQSAIDNGIPQLKAKYQGGANRGASTLISKASSEQTVNRRKDFIMERDVDPETGKKHYRETGETYEKTWTLKDGTVRSKTVVYPEKSTKMAETEDARTLSSGTRIEEIYAEHANKLKALANDARKTYLSTDNIKRDPEAAKRYSAEVESLDGKLRDAVRESPRERQAQLIANKVVQAKRKENPDLDKEHIKKLRVQALEGARAKTGASQKSRGDRNIQITPKEWEAIQAHAISNNKLMQILNNTDIDLVREYATPRTKNVIPASTKARIKSMLSVGYTQQEIAQACGVSVSSVKSVMNE